MHITLFPVPHSPLTSNSSNNASFEADLDKLRKALTPYFGYQNNDNLQKNLEELYQKFANNVYDLNQFSILVKALEQDIHFANNSLIVKFIADIRTHCFPLIEKRNFFHHQDDTGNSVANQPQLAQPDIANPINEVAKPNSSSSTQSVPIKIIPRKRRALEPASENNKRRRIIEKKPELDLEIKNAYTPIMEKLEQMLSKELGDSVDSLGELSITFFTSMAGSRKESRSNIFLVKLKQLIEPNNQGSAHGELVELIVKLHKFKFEYHNISAILNRSASRIDKNVKEFLESVAIIESLIKKWISAKTIATIMLSSARNIKDALTTLEKDLPIIEKYKEELGFTESLMARILSGAGKNIENALRMLDNNYNIIKALINKNIRHEDIASRLNRKARNDSLESEISKLSEEFLSTNNQLSVNTSF